MTQEDKRQNNLTHFGFRLLSAGSHTSRTIMLDELELLLTQVNQNKSIYHDYQKAVIDDNCLHKRSDKNRELTLRDLKTLYGLDDGIALFRILKDLWLNEPHSLPLLAFLCAICRDSLLRETTPFVLRYSIGETVSREAVENNITKRYPDRFSPRTLCSTSQNINATWTQVGYLSGRVKKVREKISPTPAAVTYALILGYLSGFKGMALFETEYMSLLDSPKAVLFNLAEEASRKGWIYMKRLGDVVEINFDKLLTEKELELINE